MTRNQSYRFTESDAEGIARDYYGLGARAEQLVGYIDQNFLLRSDGGKKFVLKIHSASELKDVIDFQNKMTERLAQYGEEINCTRALPNLSGGCITTIETSKCERRYVRLLTYVEGFFWAEVQNQDAALLEEIGSFFGRLDIALEGFNHPASRRDLVWDLKNARQSEGDIAHIADPVRRALVTYFLMQFELEIEPRLRQFRRTVIHNDGNDYNVLLKKEANSPPTVSGVIDFGDAVFTCTVCEVAIVAAYAAFGKDDPVASMASVIRGYHKQFPLLPEELEVLFYLVASRLCTSVISSAKQSKIDPENKYLTVSAEPAWSVLKRIAQVNPLCAENAFRSACGLSRTVNRPGHTVDEILGGRALTIGPSVSVSYEKPLKIVRGHRQFLFDDAGGAYLDLVNNVCHVGHCHPRVVKAASRQMALLNTNTRYLHDAMVAYARRLTATMPDPLRVCFFVCSGSEANELALRLARTHTGRRDVLVVDGAYHGNTSSIVDLSPYKFDGQGGSGAPLHVHVVPMPDLYRGPYKARDLKAGEKYARHVKDELGDAREAGSPAAMFIVESLLGCGGQIVLPEGYVKKAAEHVREAGALLVADEVQVGFGRVGTHFWGFETHGVVPDIVTLGKPIGNGYPLAAVVTTAEIARSFDNGMEYFNTYGGNPVAMSVGMAVLDVIEDEALQQNAREVGDRIICDLAELKSKHRLIGDVRGQGLFIGVELVENHATLTPAAKAASAIVERMKDKGILLSTDGPLHNVLKIKPPLVVTGEDAERFVTTLDNVLEEL